MYKFLTLIIVILLAGCDNPVSNNSGEVPDIDFTGSVWVGNVRYAKVQFVGVDQYGQPQKQADGSYYGINYYTDGSGQFSASVTGSYTGSLVGIATYSDGSEEGTSATEIKCVLPSGCKNGTQFGEWFDAPSDFEMWGAVSSVAGLEKLIISPVTHLAAKQAFNQSITGHSGCDADILNSCDGTILANGILTPESIFESNHRVKQFFLLNLGLHVNVSPWYDGLEVADSISEIESAKHGLISMSLQAFSKDRDEPVMAVLKWWVDSFLAHNGNFYKDEGEDPDIELDLLGLFTKSISVATDYEANSDMASLAALTSAKAIFLESALDLNTKTELAFSPEVFNAETEGKIKEAQSLVSKIQGWALNLESPADGSEDVQYSSFFDDEVALEIIDMESEWAQYNQKLTPAMKSFFKPIIKTAEYALTCLHTDGCDDEHDLHNKLNFADNKVSFVSDVSGGLLLDDQLYNYSSIRLEGEFNETFGQTDSYKKFSFTDVYVETTDGIVELEKIDGVPPSIAFWLNTALTGSSEPDVSRIDLDIPSLTITSKTDTKYQFSSTTFNATLVGTKDPVLTNSPFHFNILSANIDGKFSGLGGQGDSIDLYFILDSENADTYYSPNRFPDLEMSVDSMAFKNYAKLEGGGADFIADQGGWFTLPGEIDSSELPTFDGNGEVVTLGQKIELAVTFNDLGEYESWYQEDDYKLLAELLDLSYSESANLGTLVYPGGETALVIFKSDSEQTTDLARLCNRVGDSWGCQTALPVSSLGCADSEFTSGTATVIEAFTHLKESDCIAQVIISGRGVYDIDYDEPLSSGQQFDIFLNEPEYLGISNFSLKLISRFVDEADESRPVALLHLTGAAPDIENVALGFSLTHDYAGRNTSSGATIGLDSLIPYGANSIWLAFAEMPSEQDVLIYYIQESNIYLTVFGFDYAALDPDTNPFHSAPLAFIRYDGQLLGTLRKEGELYVIRYIDGSWQLL